MFCGNGLGGLSVIIYVASSLSVNPSYRRISGKSQKEKRIRMFFFRLICLPFIIVYSELREAGTEYPSPIKKRSISCAQFCLYALIVLLAIAVLSAISYYVGKVETGL